MKRARKPGRKGWRALVDALPVLPFLLLLLAGFIAVHWFGYSWLHHRHVLQRDGVRAAAVVEGRTLRKCYGFRCGSPLYFDGPVGGSAYGRFVESCRPKRRRCSWHVRYRFEHAGTVYRREEPVLRRAFLAMPVGSTVTVLVDRKRPDKSMLENSTKHRGVAFGAILVDLAFLALFLLFLLALYGRWARKEREKPYLEQRFPWLTG